MKIVVVDNFRIEVVTDHLNIGIQINSDDLTVSYYDHDSNESWSVAKDFGDTIIV